MKNSTILAKNVTLSLDTHTTHLNNNMMIVGASGRGKSRGVIAPNIMQMNSNYVISDPKGVLVEQLGTMLEKNGYRIKVLNLVNLKLSCRYNPLLYIKDDLDLEKLIEFLADNIHPNGIGRADPFWDDSAKNLISAMLYYLFYECDESHRTFANAAKLLQTHSVSEDFEHRSELDLLFDALGVANSNGSRNRWIKKGAWM